jgi:hypothetical protein
MVRKPGEEGRDTQPDAPPDIGDTRGVEPLTCGDVDAADRRAPRPCVR